MEKHMWVFALITILLVMVGLVAQYAQYLLHGGAFYGSYLSLAVGVLALAFIEYLLYQGAKKVWREIKLLNKKEEQ